MNAAMTVTFAQTEDLDAATRVAIIQVCIAAHQEEDFYNLFSYIQTGGRHFLAYRGADLVSHAVVTTRWLQPADQPLLRNCLKSNGCRTRGRISCGCEDTDISKRLERQPMENYPAYDSSGQIWRTTTQAGYATGRQCDPVRGGGWYPVADAAKGISKVAKRLLLLWALGQGWHLATDARHAAR